jgi:hypothetical protein
MQFNLSVGCTGIYQKGSRNLHRRPECVIAVMSSCKCCELAAFFRRAPFARVLSPKSPSYDLPTYYLVTICPPITNVIWRLQLQWLVCGESDITCECPGVLSA